MGDVRAAVAEAAASSKYGSGIHTLIVVEGFMLFWDPLLVDVFDICVWLDLDYEEAFRRRMATTPMPHEHYNKSLWPNYQRYRSLIQLPNFLARAEGNLYEMSAKNSPHQILTSTLEIIHRISGGAFAAPPPQDPASSKM